MNTSEAGVTPQIQPAFSGRPPRPPKITARGIEDQPDEPYRRLFVSDPVVVEDLATALQVKPFKIVARLLRMRLFKQAKESIDFDTASLIVREHGYKAERAVPDSF